MNTTIDQENLEEIKATAEAVAPNAPLREQAAVAKILRAKGYGVRAISRFLGQHGVPVSTTAISNCFRQEVSIATKQQTTP